MSARTTSSASTNVICGAFFLNTSGTTTGCDRIAHSRSTRSRPGHRSAGHHLAACRAGPSSAASIKSTSGPPDVLPPHAPPHDLAGIHQQHANLPISHVSGCSERPSSCPVGRAPGSEPRGMRGRSQPQEALERLRGSSRRLACRARIRASRTSRDTRRSPRSSFGTDQEGPRTQQPRQTPPLDPQGARCSRSRQNSQLEQERTARARSPSADRDRGPGPREEAPRITSGSARSLASKHS